MQKPRGGNVDVEAEQLKENSGENERLEWPGKQEL